MKLLLKARQCPAAFTLLELLLVISIIGVLVSTLFVDFLKVKQGQELSLMADQSVAMLQQARGDVEAGKVRSEPDEATGEERKIYLCEGAYFEEDSAPLWTQGDYDTDAGVCDFAHLKTEHYGLSTGKAHSDLILVEGSSYPSLYVLYSPPGGKVLLYSGHSELDGDVSIHFAHSTKLDLDINLEISSLTGLISLSLGDE